MIKILDKFDLNFIGFLNSKHFTDEVVKVSVLHNYESVESDASGNSGFAVYLPELKTIMLPTETPDELIKIYEENNECNDFVIHNLAHEYKHFLQDVNSQEFNEEEADKFADEMVAEYLEVLGVCKK